MIILRNILCKYSINVARRVTVCYGSVWYTVVCWYEAVHRSWHLIRILIFQSLILTPLNDTINIISCGTDIQ